MIAAIMLVAAAATPASQELYDRALSAHSSHDARSAAGLLFTWLTAATRTAENYETAEHLLAEDLQSLGLTHAALVYEGDVVRNRSRPELLPTALANLEQWTRSTPHDEERIEAELLHGNDFGALDGTARAYVAFTQGALDLRAGEDRWAQARFAELPEGSPYRSRARLLNTAVKLQRGSPEALTDFEALAADEKSPRETRNEAHIEAGRLRFERGDFAEALAHYQGVDLPELDPGRGQLYLEEAWAFYRLGQGSRAMGLLAALDAPSYKALFLPEKFLLRALLFKDACQWLGAKRAARALLVHYASSLAAIHDRTPLAQDPVLSAAALQKGSGKRTAQLVDHLGHEREALEKNSSAWNESGLARRLGELYAQEQAEAERRRTLELQKGVQRVADELLAAAEQVSLADYEVGLALYRRGRETVPGTALTFADDKAGPGEVGYDFDGEYWNDELPVFRFVLANRCALGVAP